jgi:hypothetical protein
MLAVLSNKKILIFYDYKRYLILQNKVQRSVFLPRLFSLLYKNFYSLYNQAFVPKLRNLASKL